MVKRSTIGLLVTIASLFFALMASGLAEAKEKETILSGIFVDDIALGGKTADEAMELVKNYVAELSSKKITLDVIDGHSFVITPADLGFAWDNPGIIKEAAALGQKGNIIARYKAVKDLQHSNKVYELEYSFDSAMISDIIADECEGYNQPAIDATMEVIDGEIVVTAGQTGYAVDMLGSADLIIEFLENDWDKKDVSINLIIALVEPRGTYEELSSLTDVLGTFSTSYPGSSGNRIANIANGTRLCSSQLLYPGDEFNALDSVMPFTEENGYLMAGSFLRGELVDSLGGGICQVTTTLYNAVLLAELEITERHNHSMVVSYVDRSVDAAIAETSGKNLRFVNNTDSPVFIVGHNTSDRKVIFTIYGKEYRPANRTIEFETEILETKEPEGEIVYSDAGQPVGYVSVQSAYIGYKSRLWKIVKEDGIVVSREQINSSSYIAVPRTARVGIFTTDGVALGQIYAAIDTNNIDHIKNVAAALQANVPLPPMEEPNPDDHD
jgi:vancomycin resistance protein YoaR